MVPEVVIDGVAYRPAAASPARVGVAITTHNRPEHLAEALKHHQQHSRGATIVVVDDGSTPPATVPEGVTLIRHETSLGIPAAKNACLVALMDAGCEYLSLWDDDAYPIADEWWAPYEASPEAHLSYQFLDLSGPRKLNDITVLYEDDQHVAYSGQRGVMLWYRRDAIETVGGFDPVYGRGMYEHSDLANRIHHAGLTTWRYADVAGSNGLIHSLDEHESVQRSVPKDAREQLVRDNARIHNERVDTDTYPGFVPYRTPRNVVLTCLYGHDDDPQRPGKRMTTAQLGPLVRSVQGADVVVHTDLDPIADAETVPAKRGGVNVFFKRWLDAYRWLRDHPDVQWVAAVDGTDVTMQHEPWAHLEPGKLYVGYEPSIVANDWLRKNHPDPKVQAFIDSHPHETLLNAGVVMGDRATIMRFAHRLTAHYFDRARDRFNRRDTAGDDLGDMGAFNLIARDFDLVWGPRVTTVFRQNEENGWSWWRHK